MGRKPLSDEAKGSELRIRLTRAERVALDRAAGQQGTSTWARAILLREAKADPPVKQAGLKPPGS